MKATVYEADGRVFEIEPNDGKHFTLKEMQGIVGGTIDIQRLPKDGKIIIVNDNGFGEGLPVNEKASEVWRRNYPIAEYPHNNLEQLVGNVIVCDDSMVQ